MSKSLKIVIGAVAALVVVGGLAAWWFLRDTAPDELSVEDVADDTSDGEGDGSAGDQDLVGTWTVVVGDETQAGLRIDEEFVGGVATHTAVGRTGGVEGTVEVGDAEVTTVDVTVDLTTLEWSDAPGFPTDNRTNAIRTRGLETATFPDATFVLGAPVAFDATPADGETVTVDVTGDLTLHGVTKQVTFPVEAVRRGDDLVVATAEPVEVVLADYDIEKPTSPSVASIADAGSFEFLVVLSRG